jgi:hypothetical protein
MTRGPITFISLRMAAPYRTLAEFAAERPTKTVAPLRRQGRLLGLPARTRVLSPGASIGNDPDDHLDDAA